MNVTRLLLSIALISFCNFSYAECRSVKEESHADCRYKEGDLWCAANYRGKPYAYSDKCLYSSHDTDLEGTRKKEKSSSVDVSGLKELRQDMSYSKAREIIINAGWQTAGMAYQEVGENSNIQEKSIYWHNGWKELRYCAYSGSVPCRYEFRDVSDNLLVAWTGGECLNENNKYPEEGGGTCELSLDRWYLE